MPSSRISSSVIERIRGRIDLVSLVEDAGVALRRTGKQFTGKCPFHQDDSPSFSVSPEKQLYHCFGCGASGTVFTFVSKREGISFEEAVEKLAQRAGIPLSDIREAGPAPEEQQLVQANRFARETFHAALLDGELGAPGMAYLRKRGIREETIRDLQIGYAPAKWDWLLTTMVRNGFPPELLVRGGLLREREDGRRYDYFRNRIIFPIVDGRGDLVAFGGRAIDDAVPKYLNSPETPLYKKSEVLYFLHTARTAIQEEGRALVTEGYLDAIALYEAGIGNVVASLGTVLSETHARILRRSAEEVVFVFDGDSAGSRAVISGAPVFLSEGFRVRIALLPSGKDPDDYVREQGADAMRQRVEDSVNLVEFQIRNLAADVDPNAPETQARLVSELAALLKSVRSPILLKSYGKLVAEQFDMDPEDVWAELRRQGVSLKTPAPRRDTRRKESLDARMSVERQLLAWLIAMPSEIEAASERISPSDFADPMHQEIARLLWSASQGSEPFDALLLVETSSDDHVRELLSRLVLVRRPPDLPSEIAGCLARIERDILRRGEQRHLEDRTKEDDVDDLVVARELLELTRQRRPSKST